jgi:toxin-antitoxin system PIN domain toxin
MILVDANLLLYARLSSFTEHQRARNWLDAQLNGPAPVGLPWQSLTAFLRIAINPRVFTQPMEVAEAWKQVEEWLACSPAWIPTPTAAHAGILGQLVGNTSMTPNLVGDAHLAALAIEHGLTLCSADGDFARFQNLRWSNPLAPS